ncbi:MAG: tRNA (guanine(10)-N(2))-dimethyltransferase [Candidatus Thorarchaeota archaeon]|jgi:tRNA (guanine26-N2/guanine27-N2)-dimethyltransferase
MVILKEYTEGRTSFLSADIEHYSGEKGQSASDLPVFYNPRMQINRDLSVLFLAAYMKDYPVDLICEPLSGSGIRALRYLNEVPGDFQTYLFDVNPIAVETAEKNIAHCGFEERTLLKQGDAKILLLTESREKRYDFVDVDPFGTPAPYLNAAIQSLKPKGGLLGLTATDMPALCGVYPKVALRKYGGFSIRAPFVHELAVRLLLGHTYRIAGTNDRAIEPLACLSTDHYIRVWIRVVADRNESNLHSEKIGIIRYCPHCMKSDTLSLKSSLLDSEFEHHDMNCKGKLRVAGPLWIGDIYNNTFLQNATELLPEYEGQFHKRIPRILKEMTEEARLTDNLYTDIHALCDLHNLIIPKILSIIESLDEAEFQASRTHFRPTAIRTNAPTNHILDIIRKLIGAD